MSIQMLLLAECPYCKKHGEVFLNTRKADQEHLDQISEADFEAGPNQRIIVYNSHRPDRGPCEHCLDVYGGINWEGDPSQEQCFHWRAPIRTEIDPDRLGFDHLLDLYAGESWQEKKVEEAQKLHASGDKAIGDELEDGTYCDYEDHILATPNQRNLYDYQTQVRHSEPRFWDTWQDFTAERRPRRFEVQGQIIFAEDVCEFFRELRSLREKRVSDGHTKQKT